ncbi:hypothetical protein KL925_005229 [Ogataea polymorpha]|nr:hypothetical protein KL925_005229 [Ogataea polymorpha]
MSDEKKTITFAATVDSCPTPDSRSRKSSWGSLKSKIKPVVRARSRERPASWLLPRRFSSSSLKSPDTPAGDNQPSGAVSAPPLRSLASDSSSLELRLESSSSLVSDKSNGQLLRIKQRTKSILMLDAPSSSSESSSKPATPSNVKFTLSPDPDDENEMILTVSRPSYRRSHSMNDGSEDKEPSSVPSGRTDTTTDSPDSNKISRQRSKTLNALDEERRELSPGILNSLTGFMRRRAPTSRTTSSSRLEEFVEQGLAELLTVEDSETPAQYLDRLLENYPVTSIASLLLSNESEFFKLCMREFLARYFDFSQEPLDLSLRKFLMINELPKETQQIDRVIYEFSRHYCAQHRDAGINEDYCYILTYSLIMLHTDKFNQNNKKKMAKYEFVDNLLATLEQNENWGKSGELSKISIKAVLEYYYDNVTYTPFTNITKDQSDRVLESLVNKTPLPYPSGSFLNGTASTAAPVMMTRKRSSTFRWSSVSIDPYEYIINHNVGELKMDVPFDFRNPFLLSTAEYDPDDIIRSQIVPDEQYLDERLLGNLLNTLKGSHCSMLLKVAKSKAAFLLGSRTEVINYDCEATGEEYLITRIFKIGMLTRQETKLLSNYKSWKRYFCVLTSVGLFFFKNVSLFKMKYVMNSKREKTIVLEEKTSNTPILESPEPSFTIPNGAFAVRMRRNLYFDSLVNDNQSSQLQHCTFYIYGKHSKDVYMVDNQYELVSWINSINCLSALDPVNLPIEKLELPFTDASIGEVINLRILTAAERLEKLNQAIEASTKSLQDFFLMIRRVSLLTPFQAKTRETLHSGVKLFAVKIEWTWFELSRNSLFRHIFECAYEHLEQQHTESEGEEFVTAIDLLQE